MIGAVIGLFIVDWRITLIVLTLIPIKYKVVKFLATRRMNTFKQYMIANSDYSSWYGDSISGIKEIKLMGMDRIKTGQFIKKQRKMIKADIRMNMLDKVNEFSEAIMIDLIVSIIYILGGYLIFNKGFTIGGLMTFITYSVYVTGPISAILNIGYSFSYITHAKRFFEFIDMEQERKWRKTGKMPIVSNVKAYIRFENANFQYSEDNKLLNNINFVIKKKVKKL